MLFALVKTAVTARFSDEAISVREAAVSLVGTYVVHSPAVANAFHSAFLTGLKDTGVSVRKRTVKILQDILCSNSSYKGRASACSEMLRLAADPKEDDGVRDLIHDLFMKLWLENGEERVEQEVAISPTAPSPVSRGLMSPSKVFDVEEVQMHGANAGLVTPTPPQRLSAAATSSAKSTRSLARKIQTTRMRQRSEIASEQMVDVVKAANTGENLTSLLRELLSGVADADKNRKASERRQRKVIAQSHCAMLVDSLFEILLSVEERKSKLVENFGRELVSTIRTIRVFTDVSPPVVLRHLDTLLPYLKADNGVPLEEDAAIVGAICDILTRLSLIFDAELVEKLGTGSLGDDLERITYKFGPSALSSAVRALCSLAHHKDAGEESPFRKKLLKLATTFYSFLLKYLDNDDLGTIRVSCRLNY
jgi:cohesin loading factor subunit SCC2